MNGALSTSNLTRTVEESVIGTSNLHGDSLNFLFSPPSSSSVQQINIGLLGTVVDAKNMSVFRHTRGSDSNVDVAPLAVTDGICTRNLDENTGYSESREGVWRQRSSGRGYGHVRVTTRKNTSGNIDRILGGRLSTRRILPPASPVSNPISISSRLSGSQLISSPVAREVVTAVVEASSESTASEGENTTESSTEESTSATTGSDSGPIRQYLPTLSAQDIVAIAESRLKNQGQQHVAGTTSGKKNRTTFVL